MTTQRKILIVPDKFKGSLTAAQVADSLESAIRRHLVGGAEAEIVKLPMADGGDGSLEVVASALGDAAKRVELDTFDALMRPIKAPVLFFKQGNHQTAFIEMAKICGLAMLKPQERNPEKTTTYGLGTLVLKVVAMGVKHIVMGIGGSSTNDGGEGLLKALQGCSQWRLVKMTVACDVDNPLLGPNGATMVYGPQKGADEAMLERLERRMEWVAKEYGLDTTFPGGGAAGGLGAALQKLGGELVPGWKLFSDMLSLEDHISEADAVITGEGRFDSQSLDGKLIYGVTHLCHKYKKKPVVVCGQCALPESVWKRAGIGDVYALSEIEKDTAKCISDAAHLLTGEDVVIAGCDEAGRGCLAGPVYAAAVILPKDFYHPLLNDSKQLTESQREKLRPVIEENALAWAVTAIDAHEIDRINILNASIKGMQKSVGKLNQKPDMILIDGNKFAPYKSIPYHTVVKGDATIQAIAAASVLAKTHRDEYMRKISREFPEYGWDRNMAYPTQEHRDAIREYGITKYHRLTYNLLGEDNKLF